MATYTKNGNRTVKLNERKKVKAHIKYFNKIVAYLDVLGDELKSRFPDIKFTEDNIQDYARHYFGRDLDNMEVNLLLSKIGYVEKDNNSEH